MDAATDEQLLAAYLAQGGDGFETLVNRYASELYRFVLRFTHSSAAAEDVVQETFLQVHNSAASFDPSRRFKPWLFTIAANKARDAIRSRTRQREVPLDASVSGEQGESQTFADLLAVDPGDSPQDDATDPSDEDQRRAVRRVVEAMPDMLREVLVLAYFHRLPYREIAEILDVPLGTVKSRLHSSVAHFGQAYRAELDNQPNRDRQGLGPIGVD